MTWVFSPYASSWSPKGPEWSGRHGTPVPSLLITTRLVAAGKSQGLKMEKKGIAVGEAERRPDLARRRRGVLFGAEQHGKTAGVDRTLQVDLGVADEPDVGSWRDAAAAEGEVHRRRIGLVGGSIRRPDQ